MEMNPAQQQAVLHKDGPMLVLAGPGSGKTLVITERTKYLIQQHQIPEEQILVITFTKAAASEMKERFLTSMAMPRTRVSFGTFHAVYFTILKYAYRYDASNIIREEKRYQMFREILRQIDVEYEDEKEFIADLLSEISLVKGNRISLDHYFSVHCANEVFQKIYKEYEKKLRRANLIDFDDMLVLCYELLMERKDILALWQKKYRYILIDEFQDINKVQYDIIRLLAQPGNNLFIVGDDDQSIYRFRGAKPEIMLKFQEDYPGAKRILLDVNYRSTQAIVTAALGLVSHNEKRFPKEIKTKKMGGTGLVFHQFQTLAEENKAIAESILKLQREGVLLNDMAILIRTNMGSGSLLHKLMEYNIPFCMRDRLPNLFDHWICRDILTYIKMAMGETDRSLYLQVINRPKRYISRDCFDQPEVDLEELKDYYEDKEWMLERIDNLEYDLALLAGMKPYAAVNYIRRGVGYEEFLQEYADTRSLKMEELTDVLDEIQESARPYHTFQEWFDYMEEYKEELDRQSREYRNNAKDSITVTTMHSSKGLEFQVVFIIDANEGITPHKKAILPADIEEERRLFYVAMTRAKEQLFIFSAKERYNKTMEPSRFIEEMKKSLC